MNEHTSKSLLACTTRCLLEGLGGYEEDNEDILVDSVGLVEVAQCDNCDDNGHVAAGVNASDERTYCSFHISFSKAFWR